jgi:hypothetical protein
VTFAVPVVAVADAVKVSVLVPVVGFGENAAVTPEGSPVALRVTLPVKPPAGVTVIVLVAVALRLTVTAVGAAESVKSAAPGIVNARVALCERDPLTPFRLIFVVPAGVPVCALKLTVIVPLPFTEDGLKLAWTPAGSPLAESETLPVKPNRAPTVSVTVGFVPGGRVRLVGFTEIVKSGRPTTVRLIVAVCVIVVPLCVPVAVIVIGVGVEGTVAFAAAVNVSVLTPDPPVIDVGLKAAVTPVGIPLAVRATVPLNPLTGRIVMLVVPVLPCCTLVPFPKTVKSGAVLVGTAGNAFWMFWMNSAAKKLPAGGEFAIDPVKVLPASGFV